MTTGTHVFSWRVVSLDGHPVGGSLVFSIGEPTGRPVESAAAGGTAAGSAAFWIAKVLVYAGLFFGIGGAVFRAWIASPPSGRAFPIVKVALVGGLLATALSVGLQGADVLGLPLWALADRATWRAGLGTSYGPTAGAAATNRPASLHIHTAKAMADLTLTPGRPGAVTLDAVLLTGDFAPLEAREVAVTLENRAAGIEGIARHARRARDGRWRIDAFPVRLPDRGACASISWSANSTRSSSTEPSTCGRRE